MFTSSVPQIPALGHPLQSMLWAILRRSPSTISNTRSRANRLPERAARRSEVIDSSGWLSGSPIHCSIAKAINTVVGAHRSFGRAAIVMTGDTGCSRKWESGARVTPQVLTDALGGEWGIRALLAASRVHRSSRMYACTLGMNAPAPPPDVRLADLNPRARAAARRCIRG